MSGKKIKFLFNAPLNDLDTEQHTFECRANNPGICDNNSIADVCAFPLADGICKKRSGAWKNQYQKPSGGQADE